MRPMTDLETKLINAKEAVADAVSANEAELSAALLHLNRSNRGQGDIMDGLLEILDALKAWKKATRDYRATRR